MGIRAKRSRRSWTIQEQQRLLKLIDLYPVREIAKLMRRSQSSIWHMLYRLGANAKMGKDFGNRLGQGFGDLRRGALRLEEIGIFKQGAEQAQIFRSISQGQTAIVHRGTGPLAALIGLRTIGYSKVAVPWRPAPDCHSIVSRFVQDYPKLEEKCRGLGRPRPLPAWRRGHFSASRPSLRMNRSRSLKMQPQYCCL